MWRENQAGEEHKETGGNTAKTHKTYETRIKWNWNDRTMTSADHSIMKIIISCSPSIFLIKLNSKKWNCVEGAGYNKNILQTSNPDDPAMVDGDTSSKSKILIPALRRGPTIDSPFSYTKPFHQLFITSDSLTLYRLFSTEIQSQTKWYAC